ncbi:MAG: GNAT family N-acetyltransferase [Desulfobacteraceae bacterium]|jgi:ribosomal protein S18 acetylase RimI-like enzyme|nr:MAG: GNAT family N-acetyltransferase [Desulfobacteraceae bacterium]
MLIRQVRKEELEQVAEIFAEVFNDSIHFYFSGKLPTQVISLWLLLAQLAEPEALQVAEEDQFIRGYVFSPSETSGLWRTALSGSFLSHSVKTLIRSNLRLPLSTLRALLSNKMWFWRTNRQHGSPARILSMGVSTCVRGQGYGRRLLKAGIEYLRHKKGCPVITLEVRPHNIPARRLYESLGFVKIGETRDAQGPWLIMQLNS